MSTKNKKGRPKVKLSDLPEGWKDRILTLKSDGASDVECRVALNISNDLWYRLIEDEKEFSETLQRGNELCEAWWLKQGRVGMYQTMGGKQVHTNLNSSLFYMNMKNRFGWKDKQEIEAKVSGNITVNIKTKRDK